MSCVVRFYVVNHYEYHSESAAIHIFRTFRTVHDDRPMASALCSNRIPQIGKSTALLLFPHLRFSVKVRSVLNTGTLQWLICFFSTPGMRGSRCADPDRRQRPRLRDCAWGEACGVHAGETKGGAQREAAPHALSKECRGAERLCSQRQPWRRQENTRLVWAPARCRVLRGSIKT